MQATFLTKIVLPAALFIIMLGMGLSLSWPDFKRVAKHPKAVAIGIFGQMVLLPLIGLGVVMAFGMTSALGLGLIILALCPGGTTSNMISFLARGDLALSITLTAVVSLLTPLTIPIFGGLAMTYLMGEGAAIELPFVKTVLTLVVITIVPVALGMTIHRYAPRFSKRAETPVKVLSTLFLFLVIAGVVKQTWAELPGFFAQTGLASLTLNVLAMGLGYGIANAARLKRAQSITIGVEVGIQNGTTALLVTGTILQNPTMSIAPAIYSLIMFGTGAIFAVLVNLGRPAEEPTEAEAALEPARIE
ncbi:MAG: bile acid:sodium symporter family protein [Myxococcales bacterium]|nr:bile acid:sodium symporter family protein [Myxococcales bacterium]